MRDITMLILACRDLLKIETPFSIEYKLKFRGKNKDCAGVCYSVYKADKLVKFKISINCNGMVESDYDSYSVIAHEMVHAKMIEYDLHNDDFHHDKNFANICCELEKQLKGMGFPITCPLYNPLTDIS